MKSNNINRVSIHAAIIMDGNGRWAERRGWPRATGHRAGVDAVRSVVRAAPDLGITTLTLFAFSSDNWRRPAGEVSALMGLLAAFLEREAAQLATADVRLSVIGRRDRLPPAVATAISQAERATENGRALHLRLAVDYSSRGAIAEAAMRLAREATPTMGRLDALIQDCSAGAAGDRGAGPVDLLIRTGGEQRLSDFLLWESAYAELVFSDVMWPDFTTVHLRDCLDAFQRRQRRFGGLMDSSHSNRAATISA